MTQPQRLFKSYFENPKAQQQEPKGKLSDYLDTPKAQSYLQQYQNEIAFQNVENLESQHSQILDKALKLSKLSDKTKESSYKLQDIMQKSQSHVISNQLYKDVDSDNQQRLLHSNVYIGDDNILSAKQEVRNVGSLPGIGVQFSTIQINAQDDSEMSQKDRLNTDRKFTESLPLIHQYQQFQSMSPANFKDFKKNFLQVKSDLQKNIQMELRKKQSSRFERNNEMNAMLEAQNHRFQSERRSLRQNLSLLQQMRDKQSIIEHVEPQKQETMQHRVKQIQVQPSISNLSKSGESAGMDFQPQTQILNSNLLSQDNSVRQLHKSIHERSKSVVQSVMRQFESNQSLHRHPSKMSLGESAMANKNSRIQNILTTPIVPDFTPSKPIQVTQFYQKRNTLKDLIAVPKVDPRKIRLEMDFLDKAKILEEEKQVKKDVGFSREKEAEPSTYSAADQIEIVRRQLVLTEMNLQIPTNPDGTIDVNKLLKIQIIKEADQTDGSNPELIRQRTCLKNLKLNDDVLTMVQPTFPIMQIKNKNQDQLKVIDQKVFDDEILKIVSKQNKLMKFADKEKTETGMMLKIGMFREKLGNLNKFLDIAFKGTSEALLNDELLIHMYKDQIKKEIQVKGKPLYSIKPTTFDARWKIAPNWYTKTGIEISHNGMLLDDAYKKRERHMRELLEIYSKRKEQHHKSESAPVFHEEADSINKQSNFQGASQLEMRDDDQGEESIRQSNMKTYNNDDVSVMSSVAAPQTVSATKMSPQKSSVEPLVPHKQETLQSSHHNKFVSLSHKQTSDPEVLSRLIEVEKELFLNKDKTAFNSKKFGFELTENHKKQREKYFRSLQQPSNQSAKGQKIVQEKQSQLLKEITLIIEDQVYQERLKRAMIKEKEDYEREQVEAMNEILKNTIQEFKHKAQHDKAVLDYVLDQEANESDEDFNVFDQIAQNLKDAQINQKMYELLLQKINKVKLQVASEDQSNERVHQLLNATNLDQVLSRKVVVPGSSSKLKLQAKPQSDDPVRKSQSDFNKRMSISYYDDEMEENKPKEKNIQQHLIQKEIAEMSKKLILMGSEHHSALNHYLDSCSKQQIMPLPILNKVKKFQNYTNLTLEDYLVNSGQIQALAEVLPMFGANSISKVYLSNNNLLDADTSILFKGILSNPHIYHLEIAQNKLDTLGVEALCAFFQKPRKQLKSLKLSDNKASMQVTNRLLEGLANYSFLTELKLSNFTFSSTAVEHLGTMLEGALYLNKLDLSWNKFNSKDLLTMTEKLKSNNTLNELNLKNNVMSKAQSEQIAGNLRHFIKNNKVLQHLNISYMYFSSDEIILIMEAVSKSKSMLSIHVSGNQVDGKNIRAKIRSLMKPRKRIKTFDQQREDPDTEVGDENEEQPQYSKQNPSSAMNRENDVRLPETFTQASKELKDDMLIYTRILGHFEIPQSHKWIETQSCWYCENHCYTLVLASNSICKQYYLKPTMAEREILTQKLEKADKKRQHEFQAHQADLQNEAGSEHDEYCYDAEEGNDFTAAQNKRIRDQFFRNHQIAGKFTGWKCKSLIPLRIFMKMLMKNKEDQTQIVQLDQNNYEQQIQEIKINKDMRSAMRFGKYKKKAPLNFNSFKVAKKEQSAWYDTIFKVDAKTAKQGWLDELLKLLPYRKYTNFAVDPALLTEIKNIHSRPTEDGEFELKEKVFAYACFLPQGKYKTCVLHNANEDSSLRTKNLYQTIIKVAPRQHNIDLKFKRTKKYKVERKFFKKSSIFKEWIETNFIQAVQTDIEYSQIDKLAKDPAQMEKIEEILVQNAQLIIENFQYMISQSQYSCITWNDFSNFCGHFKLIDEVRTLKQQDIFELVEEITNNSKETPGKPQQQLCRNEYLELLVRIAKHKFMDKGKCPDLVKALQLLFDNHLNSNPLPSQGGQTFRDQFVWKLEIDDLMKNNMLAIKEVYNSLISGFDSVTQKPLSELDFKSLQRNGFNKLFGLNDHQMCECYSLSKIVHTDELQNFGAYKRMKLIEFCEFLVRISDKAFGGIPGISTTQKIEKVLEVLFREKQQTLVKTQTEVLVSSESDYRSDD